MSASKVTHSASGTHVIAGATKDGRADKRRKTQGSWRKRKPFALGSGVPTCWDQIMPEITNLFVYGTLMPGELNYRQIEKYVINHKPGTIEGILVDLGAYPALIEGEGRVRGDVFEINADALEITDRIEGYYPNRDRCLYLRQKTVVTLETKDEATAWTYLFANPDAIVDCPRLFVGESDEKPIFAWRNNNQSDAEDLGGFDCLDSE
jgi:gamma-glutamylcyclotransferase (GGCT)/AIG2-like uncharacterized protein YtfP